MRSCHEGFPTISIILDFRVQNNPNRSANTDAADDCDCKPVCRKQPLLYRIISDRMQNILELKITNTLQSISHSVLLCVIYYFISNPANGQKKLVLYGGALNWLLRISLARLVYQNQCIRTMIAPAKSTSCHLAIAFQECQTG